MRIRFKVIASARLDSYASSRKDSPFFSSSGVVGGCDGSSSGSGAWAGSSGGTIIMLFSVCGTNDVAGFCSLLWHRDL